MNRVTYTLLFVIYITSLLVSNCFANDLAVANVGQIKRFEAFSSQWVPPRNIDVWLPSTYNSNQQHDVLYMHDGQMLFDSSITWNNQEWKVDEVANKLIESGRTKPFIVVGIWNAGAKRYPEYFPEKVYRGLSTSERWTIKSKLVWQSKSLAPIGDFFYADNYLKFLTKELIPFVESTFNVNKNPNGRYLAGSSMGGLISWYGLLEYPDVFGGAACLSTHWPGMYDSDNPIPAAFARYIEGNLHKLNDHKLYFDLGDQTLDAMYPKFQKEIDAIMRKSYPSNQWRSEFFPGHRHDEASWSSRLHIPLTFLFEKQVSP